MILDWSLLMACIHAIRNSGSKRVNISVYSETEGFNLEFAWSSGYLARTAIAGAVLASCTAGTRHGQNLEHLGTDKRMNI